MKLKTTAKSIRNNGGKIIAIGYCGAQHLLQYESAIAYTCGVYGWNFDVYEVDGATICTGYRGMPGKHIDYSLLREYENKAEKIVYDCHIPYDQQRAQVKALLHDLITKV